MKENVKYEYDGAQNRKQNVCYNRFLMFAPKINYLNEY